MTDQPLHRRADGEAKMTVVQRALAESRTASAALQHMVDALASLPALDHFVPIALRIVADAFETSDCAFYQHRRGDPIRLRYWFFKGQVFGPEDIRAFADDHPHADIKILEAGFLMPDTYLGVPFRKRIRAQVVDHGGDRPGDEWYDLRRRLDWYLSLNVPLVVGGEADGALLINRGRGGVFTGSEIDLAERLAQQLALAMEIDRMAADVEHAAVAEAREAAARAQIEEMAKTDRALQQTTDALAAMPDLDNFIPAALQIIAMTFDLKDCAYYEHRHTDWIRLRYWFVDDRVLTPSTIALLGEEDAFMRSLAVDGFTVPDDYLGVPFRLRTKPSVVDHTAHQPPSVFDDECNRRGWQFELNVPLVVAGEADGALLIYRGSDAPFSPREIALAGRLGQLLAFAMEASWLSAAVKDAAIARERGRAMRERASELARYSDVLQQTIDSLVDQEDFRDQIGRLLMIASDRLHAPITEYWDSDGLARTKLVLTCRNGTIYPGSDDLHDVRVSGIPIEPELIEQRFVKVGPTHQSIDMLNDAAFRRRMENLGMPVAKWCEERAVQRLIIIPLLRSKYAHGWLCLYLPYGLELEQPQIDLALSLAQQISLALRMIQLAEESNQNILFQARESAANDRAAELTKANHLLRSALEQLSDERDLAEFPRSILRMAMEQCGARDGVIFIFDELAGTLGLGAHLASPEAPFATPLKFAQPFPADSAPIWAKALQARGPIVCDVGLDGDILLPGAVAWHRDRGNHSVVVVPMFIDTKPYGYFGMGLAQSATTISNVDLELVQALTQQASLAIQLSRLAEESKQAAIAQQRERDAQERAAEFAKANDVLRSTLARLAQEPDLASFPRAILHEAMVQTGAHDAIILKFDKYSDSLIPSEYLNADGAAPSEDLSRPYPTSKTSTWKTLVATRAPAVFAVADNLEAAPAGLSKWHDDRGNRSVVSVAMFIGQEPYGYFGITLRENAANVSNIKVGLIHALSQQATLAIQLTHLADASQQAAVMLERQQVVVQERANMGREIHDRLAQGYAAILMQQHTMRRTLLRATDGIGEPSPLLKQLDIIERLSRDNLADARRTMDELRLDPFGQSDLQVALRQCVGHPSEDDDFAVSLILDDDLPPLRRYMTTELCRIVQEAVTNARKHSRSRGVRVRVARAEADLHISVEDDGTGFDMRTIGSSFGIAGMHERAARAGSHLTLTSAPGHGTTVRIVVTP